MSVINSWRAKCSNVATSNASSRETKGDRASSSDDKAQDVVAKPSSRRSAARRKTMAALYADNVWLRAELDRRVNSPVVSGLCDHVRAADGARLRRRCVP